MRFGRKRRAYDDYDREGGEHLRGSQLVEPLHTDRRDWLIAAGLGVFSAVLLWALSYRGLHPSAWSDCAVAAGIRPPTAIFPGLWRALSAAIYSLLGIGAGNQFAALSGKALGGLTVALVYMTFREIVAILVRINEPPRIWKTVLSRAVCLTAAILFLAADPFWTLAQACTAEMFDFALFAAAVFCFAHFLGAGTVRPIYWGMWLLGLFCAESPIGFMALIAFWLMFYLLLRHGGIFHVQLLEPLKQQSSKWYLTFFWAVGFIAGVAVNVLGFKAMDGLAANALALGDLPLRYCSQMWTAFVGFANAGGWLVGIALAVLPFMLAIGLLRRATDVEYFMSYHIGIIFFIAGCLAYTQLASLQPLWLWTIDKSIAVNDRIVLACCSFMSAATVLSALVVTLIDAFCRDHRFLAQQITGEIDEADRSAAPARSLAVRSTVFILVGAALLAGALTGRRQPKTMRMLAIVDDFVRETVNEAGDAKWLFTGGEFDNAIELEAARRGRSLKCIPLLPGISARSRYLLEQAMTDEEDRLSAAAGGANVLSTWHRDKPERMRQSAFQVGFELWSKRSGRAYPPLSGVLARVEWPDAEACAAGLSAGLSLFERVLKIYTDGGPVKVAGKLVNDLFVHVQWRLARLARVRSEAYDHQGDTERARQELAMAETLDERNLSVQELIERLARAREHTMRQMTPREGLHFALVRADFALARRYAEPILDAAPSDVDANFAMGMSYLVEEQYGRAEEYLQHCLMRAPKEPAFWNNIAVIQYRMGRLREARQNAVEAQRLAPDSVEVRDTLKLIDEAIAKEAKGDEAAAAGEAVPQS